MCQSCGSQSQYHGNFVRANLPRLIASPDVIAAGREWIRQNFRAYDLMPVTLAELSAQSIMERIHEYYAGGIPQFVIDMDSPGNADQAADTSAAFDLGGEG